jgi:hypothetical protein
VTRRIVTGIDADGRSCVIEDRQVPESTMGNTHLWLRGPADRENDGREPMPFFPAPGQSVFRVVRLPPPDPAMTAGALAVAADAFFSAIGDAWCRSDTARDPFMHRTPTTDYITVLSGQVSLLLETGEGVALRPFDTVIQRQTNHAWQVTGTEPAVLLVVMIGDPHRRLER